MKLESISASCSSSERFLSVSPSANPFHSLHLQLLWPVKEKIDYPPLCNPVSFPEHGFSCAPHEAPRHEQRMFSNGMNPSASQLPACISPPVPIHAFSAVMCPDLSQFPFCYYFYTYSLPFLQYLSQSLSFHCSCNVDSFDYHLHSRPNDSKPEMQKRSPIH